MTLLAPPVIESRRRVRPVLLGVLVGAVLAVAWSPELVDAVIAGHVARPLLGGDPATLPLAGTAAAVAMAFVTGLAGTFTACNVAVFTAIMPAGADRRGSVRAMLTPIAALVGAAVVVSAAYGAIAILTGGATLQLSDERVGALPIRLLQSAIVFSVIGVIMLWRSLAAADLVHDQVSALLARRPTLEVALLGGLVGAFVIGRPFPPFRHLFAWAVATDDAGLGAGLFALQTLGNLTVVVLLVLLLGLVTRGRAGRRLAADPQRTARITAAALAAGGTFFLVYWGVETLHRAGLIGWIPLPWT